MTIPFVDRNPTKAEFERFRLILLNNMAAKERTRWDPKDGELCLSRMKPEETLVEVRSGSDVQIDRQTWV